MRHRLLAIGLALFAVCGAAGAQQNVTSAALLAAVNATQSAKTPYAFELSFESPKANLRAHFDPHATPRLTMIAPAEASLSGDQRRIFDALQQQLEGVSWCAGERMGNVTGLRVLREDADTATYSFQPTRTSMRGQAAQYADHLRGEMTLTKAIPDVSSVHIFLAAPFDPLPLVHISSFDIAVTCAVAPNGRRYAAQTVAVTTGGAFGQNINERNVQRVTNLSASP